METLPDTRLPVPLEESGVMIRCHLEPQDERSLQSNQMRFLSYSSFEMTRGETFCYDNI
jgi:hypothetical protein